MRSCGFWPDFLNPTWYRKALAGVLARVRIEKGALAGVLAKVQFLYFSNEGDSATAFLSDPLDIPALLPGLFWISPDLEKIHARPLGSQPHL